METRKECFEALCHESNFLDIMINNFKSENSNATYEDFIPHFMLARSSEWFSSDTELTKEYFENLKFFPADCNYLMREYKSKGVLEYCHICSHSRAFKNYKIHHEEIVIAYFLGHSDVLKNVRGLVEGDFDSVQPYVKNNFLKTTTLLKHIYMIIREFGNKNSTVLLEKESIKKHLIKSLKQYEEPEESELLDRYIDLLFELKDKVKKPQYEESRKIVVGLKPPDEIKGPASKSQSTIMSSYIKPVNAKPLEVLPLERPEQEQLDIEGLHSTDSSNTQDKEAITDEPAEINTPHGKVYQYSIFDANVIAQTGVECNLSSLPNELDIATVSKYELKGEQLQPKIEEDTIDNIVEPEEEETMAVEIDTEKLSAEEIIFNDNYLYINTIEDFDKIRNKLILINEFVVMYFNKSNKVILKCFGSDINEVYVLDLSVPSILNEFIWLMKSPAANKIINNIIPLGQILNSQIFKISNVFEIVTAQELVEGKISFESIYTRINNPIKDSEFTDKDTSRYSGYAKHIYKKYRGLHKKVGELDKEGLLNQFMLFVYLVAKSKDTASDTYKYLSCTVCNPETELEIGDSVAAIYSEYSKSKASLIMDQSILSILRSRFVKDIDVALKEYKENYITLGCTTPFDLILFDVMNQFTTNIFVEVLQSNVRPSLKMIIED